MQLTRRLWPVALAAGLCAACSTRGAADELLDPSTLGTLYRSFTDSGHVTVQSLMGDYALPLMSQTALSLHWNNEHVRIPGISAPPGSQEAIDAITTASRPITNNAYQDYIKVRNEMQGELSHDRAAVNYYLSSEVDYLAQQLGGKYNRDFHDQRLNVSVGTSYGWDEIKPLADSDTRPTSGTKTTLHGDAVATQILSPTTLLRWGIEVNVVDGLQHNPYRNVYAGGTHVPERHPDHRQRRDTFLRLNQYLANRSSLKLSYRLYNDDWGITSHELASSINQYITHGMVVSYEYRYYTQTRAYFFRDEYATTTGIDGYLSGDYRMNYLASHLFGASTQLDMGTLAPSHAFLRRTAVWLNWERYFNSNNYSANILESGVDFHFR
ncbi:MAG TPA: DUF3570 domain-containing protein [Candidatus Eisenbacteria bacterium]